MMENKSSASFAAKSEYCVVPINNSSTIRHYESIDLLAWKWSTAVICSVGVAFNLLLLFIGVRFSSWRQGGGLFIAHLLFCHFVMCAAILPAAVHLISQQATNPQSTRCHDCRYLQPFHSTFTFIINWSEALLACHRIVAICLPLQFHRCNRKSIQRLALAFCWTLALSTSLPVIFNVNGSFRMNPLGACVIDLSTRTIQTMTSINNYCPLALTILGTVVITTRFMRGVPNRQRVSVNVVDAPLHGNARSMTRQQKRTTKMLVMSFGLILLCQLPFYVITLTFTSLLSKYPKLLYLFRTLSAIQYAVTPVVSVELHGVFVALLLLLPHKESPCIDTLRSVPF
ncbi:hypothetical protein BV898_00448 [Hypsibius exemplaris]|uniref:G-protein coupled receptors family 1 profile domain-containing protein n=1 Tax=Hypsibius exemplaris TaxID=2072580 RepID=A0A1W0XDM6_HYPEX|nr:hypothetical protein BV898_00448 [Hypsibius exemplaris]